MLNIIIIFVARINSLVKNTTPTHMNLPNIQEFLGFKSSAAEGAASITVKFMTCIHPQYSFLVPYKTKHIFTFTSSTGTPAALSEKGTDGNVGEDDRRNTSAASPSARSQLDLLEQLTTSPSDYGSDRNYGELTIREKLIKLVGDRDDDFTMRLGKKMKVPKLLTVSQKRNIRRQSYLNEVSRRNDSNFFAAIGAFVLLPPIIILGVAIATGYVQLFP